MEYLGQGNYFGMFIGWFGTSVDYWPVREALKTSGDAGDAGDTGETR